MRPDASTDETRPRRRSSAPGSPASTATGCPGCGMERSCAAQGHRDWIRPCWSCRRTGVEVLDQGAHCPFLPPSNPRPQNVETAVQERRPSPRLPRSRRARAAAGFSTGTGDNAFCALRLRALVGRKMPSPGPKVKIKVPCRENTSSKKGCTTSRFGPKENGDGWSSTGGGFRNGANGLGTSALYYDLSQKARHPRSTTSPSSDSAAMVGGENEPKYSPSRCAVPITTGFRGGRERELKKSI
jgi:hypothetical protein